MCGGKNERFKSQAAVVDGFLLADEISHLTFTVAARIWLIRVSDTVQLLWQSAPSSISVGNTRAHHCAVGYSPWSDSIVDLRYITVFIFHYNGSDLLHVQSWCELNCVPWQYKERNVAKMERNRNRFRSLLWKKWTVCRSLIMREEHKVFHIVEAQWACWNVLQVIYLTACVW